MVGAGEVLAAERAVSGDDGRQFHGAVTFHRQDAEPLLECLRQVPRELLRAAENHVQRPQFVRLAAPQIGPEEGRRGDQDRAAVLAAERADLPCLQGRVVVNALVDRRRGPSRA